MKRNLRHKLLSMTRTFTRRSLDLRPGICTQNSKTQVLWLSKFVMFVMFECHCAIAPVHFRAVDSVDVRRQDGAKLHGRSLGASHWKGQSSLRKLRRPTRLKHPRLRLLRPRAGAKKIWKILFFGQSFAKKQQQLSNLNQSQSPNCSHWRHFLHRQRRRQSQRRRQHPQQHPKRRHQRRPRRSSAGVPQELRCSSGARKKMKKCLTQQRRRRDQQKNKNVTYKINQNYEPRQKFISTYSYINKIAKK